MSLMVISIIMAINLSFPIVTSPATAAIWIIAMALMLALSLAIFSSSWVALIIFLIYIGGMLVIFFYFCSLSPNKEYFMTPSFMAMFLSFMTMFVFLSYMSIHYSTTSKSIINHSTMISSMYYPNMATMLIMAILILFITMVSVV